MVIGIMENGHMRMCCYPADLSRVGTLFFAALFFGAGHGASSCLWHECLKFSRLIEKRLLMDGGNSSH